MDVQTAVLRDRRVNKYTKERNDMIHWSEPVRLMDGEKEFGNHYVAMVADDKVNQPNIVVGDTFSILSNHNGTDVARHMARFWEK